MARHHISSLDRRGIADFDELAHKKIHRILRSCLTALYFDLTTLIEIAVYNVKTTLAKLNRLSLVIIKLVQLNYYGNLD